MQRRQSRLIQNPSGILVTVNVTYHGHDEPQPTVQTVTHGTPDEKVYVLRVRRDQKTGNFAVNVDTTGANNLRDLCNAVIGYMHQLGHDVDGSCALEHLDVPGAVVMRKLSPEALAGAALLANPDKLSDELDDALVKIIDEADRSDDDHHNEPPC